ncbi:capsule biosynthesis protein [Pseudoroseicyclus sp. H15]
MSQNPNEGGPRATGDGDEPKDQRPANAQSDDKSVLSLAERKAAIARAQAEKTERLQNQGGGHTAKGNAGKAQPRPEGQATGKAAPAKAPNQQPQPQKPKGQSAAQAATRAAPARSHPRKRHWSVVFAFLYIVVVPVIASSWYLWERAIDRYASEAGLSIRTQEVSSALELLGGVAALGGGSSNDVDILHQYLQSQEMVTRIDSLIDLRSIWSKGDEEQDPIFVYHAPGTIEDLVNYWGRMVHVYKDGSTGLLNIETEAFTPEDAQLIAETIVAESSRMINRLSYDAQQDATRYARDELDLTVERLKTAREAITRFRNDNQIVDPEASITSQMGILSQLQSQLANSLIEVDMLRQTAGDTDPRIEQEQRRIAVIEQRIAEERAKLGLGGDGRSGQSELFADLVGEYESLAVDLNFAEQSYAAARASYDAAVAESQRQSRYLATHVRPTLAETPEYPQRLTILALIAFFAFLIWAMGVLAYYAFKDRR